MREYLVESGSELAMAVHGGASRLPQVLHGDYLNGVEKALRMGRRVLEDGGSALEACLSAVEIMEDDTTFNAGLGSLPNRDGDVEMDAAVMVQNDDGSPCGFGAVALVRGVRNPCHLARLLMEEEKVNILGADAAVDYARIHGLELLSDDDFRRGYEKKLALIEAHDRTRTEPQSITQTADTVSAVAKDAGGNLVAVTSTGGVRNKEPGRIGDSPLPGAGLWADRYAAVSATGYGEEIMQAMPCIRITLSLAAGCSVQKSVEDAMLALEAVAGRGGLIMVDRQGRLAAACNMPQMPRAFWSKGSEIVVKI